MLFNFFERLIPPFPATPPDTPPTGLWRFCLHYSRGAVPYLLAMALLTGLIAVMEVSLFGFLGQLVDWLQLRDPEHLWQESRTELLAMSLMLLVGLPLVVWLHSLLMHQTLLGPYPMAIRWQAHRYLLGQSLSFYHNEFAGRIATKVMQTSLAVRDTLIKLLDIILYVLVYFSGAMLLVASLNPVLVLPFVIWFALYGVLLRYFLPRLGAAASVQANARSDMTGRLVDTYTNISTVKLFSHSDREAQYARHSMQRFLATVFPQMRLVTWLNSLLWLLNALLIFSTAALGLSLWSEQLLTAGALAAAVGLVLRINGMAQWILWEIAGLFENLGTVRDGMQLLGQPREVQDRPEAPPLKVSQGHIQFDQVSFAYPQAQPLLTNFNLTLAAGEKIGLVGRSGAGKSTLVNLLLRFYDLQQGQIRIDGQNIAEVSQDSLRAQIGMVTQDTSLLHRSIRDNLLYGNPDATEIQMRQAALDAEAEPFIGQLLDNQGNRGYDAEVGERGVKLSGGQRQRIAIARVLLKNAPILLLDEATSALDSEVEAAIQTNLSRLMAGKTVIAIAHRLSTIAALDRLIVVDQGRIVEQGTHAQLLAQGGIYAELWAHQSGGFLGER